MFSFLLSFLSKKKAKFCVCPFLFFPKKGHKLSPFLKRYAHPKSLCHSFFLSLSLSLRRRTTTTRTVARLVCILERRPSLPRKKIFEFTKFIQLTNSNSNRRTESKNKNLHSPPTILIEHGRRRDQSNELDHPVVAPRSVHGVSDAGVLIKRSLSLSLSSCCAVKSLSEKSSLKSRF